ncbi:MAG: hypothetical protein H7X91_05310 [Burkholderiales bacterium]|nr:hypothetical protein [Burkholderiales bacterium]
MRAVVVHHQIHVEPGRHVGVDGAQELQELATRGGVDAVRRLRDRDFGVVAGGGLLLDYIAISIYIMVFGGLAIALSEVVDDAIIDCQAFNS